MGNIQNIKAYLLRKDRILYHAAMVLILAITWLGFFDEKALAYVNELRSEVFKVFIGLKALESVASIFSESNASLSFFGTGIEVAVGGFLKPLLSFSEKASNVLLLSVLSLSFHKFVMILMSASTLKLAVTGNVLILYGNQVKPFLNEKVASILFKVMLVFVVLKLMAPVAMFLVSEISEASISGQSGHSQRETEAITNKLEKIQQDIYTAKTGKKTKATTSTMLVELRQSRKELAQERDAKVKLKNDLYVEDEDAFSHAELVQRKRDIDLLLSELEGIHHAMDKLDVSIARLKKSPGFFDAMMQKIKAVVEEFNAKLRVFIESMVTTLMLFLLRTIIIPLVFLWIIYAITAAFFRGPSFEKFMQTI